jgi:ABC-type lipoprotein export system ATPase subunit
MDKLISDKTVLALLEKIARKNGNTVILVTHNSSFAAISDHNAYFSEFLSFSI